MRQLLILWLTASAAALVAGGCNAVPTAPPASPPPHARWSPGYMGAIGNTLAT